MNESKTEPPTKRQLKPKSRTRRWADAASRAEDALNEMEEIRAEYEEWHGNLPENLQNSALGEKLQAIVDLDVQSAIDMASEATGLDLPLGFGRD